MLPDAPAESEAMNVRGKRPTLRQKKAIAAMSLNPDNWLIAKAPPGELHLIHRFTGTKKVIPA